MVTDMAAVPAETRSGSARAVFLKRAGRDPQIMRRLFGAEEGRPLQRTRRARILVVVVARPHGPRSFQARPRPACRRSEERRVGKACVRTCRSPWSPEC